MIEPDEALTLRMFTAVPGLRSEMDEYQRRYVGDWDGPQADVDHLPGFLVKLALDCRRRGAERRDLTRQLFAFLESELGSDEELDGLIEVFFAAYLPAPTDRSADILTLLGPKLWEARENQLLDDGAGVLESVVEFVFRFEEEFPELADRVVSDRRYNRLADDLLVRLAPEASELVAQGRWMEVAPVLEFLELEYGENPAVDNAINVSFLELLPAPGQRGGEIVRLLGPELSAAWRRIDPPTGPPIGNR
ncbi:hypothetical protein AB0E69_04130 [Kribbella sp. NPDC026611]|uniref:DUF7674 family protein n=1 Tax=Kribbella sp. NPDC026611 TaxID=3154911 RepID=UPI0033FDBA3D